MSSGRDPERQATKQSQDFVPENRNRISAPRYRSETRWTPNINIVNSASIDEEDSAADEWLIHMRTTGSIG